MITKMLITTMVIATISAMMTTQVYASSNEEIRESCGNQGFEDGQNGPFNTQTHQHCGDDNSGGDDAYLEEFMKGCLSVDGNTRDVCENATDA